MTRLHLPSLLLAAALLGCTPCPARGPEGPRRAPTPSATRPDAAPHLRLAWSTQLAPQPFSSLSALCRYSSLTPEPDGGVVFSGEIRRPKPGRGEGDGEEDPGFWDPQREGHALYRADSSGRVERIRLGPAAEAEGEILALTISPEQIVAASRFGRAEDTDPPPHVVLSVRAKLGAPARATLRLDDTRQIWPLSGDRWLSVGGSPPYSMDVARWDRRGHGRRAHPSRASRKTPEDPYGVYWVESRGDLFLVKGFVEGHVPVASIFGADGRHRWHVLEESFSGCGTFDLTGNLWCAGFAYPTKTLGKARFPVPPRLPESVRKAPGDVPLPPPASGQMRAFPDSLQSLFGDTLHSVSMRPERGLDPSTITDGLLLRYSPAGELTLVEYYPVGAIGWLAHALPEAGGITVVAFIEGRIPAAFRGHPGLPEGFTGATLLVHYDDRGRVLWAEPLGEGERLVRHILPVPDGYVTLSVTEEHRCELSRWVRGGDE